MIRYANRLPPGSGLSLISDQVVRKVAIVDSLKRLSFLEKLCNHLIKHPDPTIVPVYKFEKLEQRPYHYKYSYDMMRLGMISTVEKKMIDMASSRYVARGLLPTTGNFSAEPGKDNSLEFPSLLRFVENMLLSKKYTDIHGGNIMKDIDDNYRIIDLEGFYFNIEDIGK